MCVCVCVSVLARPLDGFRCRESSAARHLPRATRLEPPATRRPCPPVAWRSLCRKYLALSLSLSLSLVTVESACLVVSIFCACLPFRPSVGPSVCLSVLCACLSSSLSWRLSLSHLLSHTLSVLFACPCLFVWVYGHDKSVTDCAQCRGSIRFCVLNSLHRIQHKSLGSRPMAAIIKFLSRAARAHHPIAQLCRTLTSQ